jgi:undecaprenyl-diphosphatase
MGPFGNATLLGALQGLTEFLPVSSSGHLSLASIVLGIEGGGLTLNVMLHAGTLVATLLVLWQRVLPALRDGVLGLANPKRFITTNGGRDALVVILASIPTALIGLSLRHSVEQFTRSPTALGVGFLISTALLVSTRWATPGEAPSLAPWGAILVGVVQGLSVMPGVSRSGATIAAALWMGVRRDRAFELSMLMSLPAVLGAVLLEAPKVTTEPAAAGVALLGSVVALVTGVIALVLLRRIVTQGRFAWFALWVGPLAVATLAMAKAWPER